MASVDGEISTEEKAKIDELAHLMYPEFNEDDQKAADECLNKVAADSKEYGYPSAAANSTHNMGKLLL